MNTDKITLNVNAIDLANIDLLVENGFATNRSELMKTAIKTYLANLESDTKQLIQTKQQEAETNHWHWFFGFNKITEKFVNERIRNNKKVSITSYGMFKVDKNISLELMKQCITELKIYGPFKASKEIKDYYKKSE